MLLLWGFLECGVVEFRSFFMLVAEIGDFLKYYHDHLSISCLVDGTSSLLSRPPDYYFPICGLPDHNKYIAPVMRKKRELLVCGFRLLGCTPDMYLKLLISLESTFLHSECVNQHPQSLWSDTL
jgi:hypothetical protein